MARCNELCTKEATGKCALCDALAERDRFIRRWFKGGLFIDGFRVLRQWWCPVPCTEIRHKDVVREVHKQYSETLNKTMLTLLGVALFCLLTTIGSPDKLLLAGDSTIKVPFADTPLSFLGFIVVAPLMTPKMPATLIQTVVVEGALCGYCTNRCRSSILGSISCNGRAVISTYMKNNQASPST